MKYVLPSLKLIFLDSLVMFTEYAPNTLYSYSSFYKLKKIINIFDIL